VPHAQLYGLPPGILHVFNTILYENECQNPQIFQQTISLFLSIQLYYPFIITRGSASQISATRYERFRSQFGVCLRKFGEIENG
jgi:hypothetical protein